MRTGAVTPGGYPVTLVAPLAPPPAATTLRTLAALLAQGVEPGRDRAGSVTMAQCREIAEMKMKDLNAMDLDAATKIIAGSARSMGLEVVA